MQQKIFVLGASGGVGRELIHQIHSRDSVENNVNPSQIVGVANSSNYIFNSQGLDDSILNEIISSRQGALDVMSQKGEKLNKLENLLQLIKSEGLGGDVIFTDVTAGKDELFEMHKSILTESKNKLVTANKNPISLYGINDFNNLTSEYGRYDTNTTVMGGAGILNFINEREFIHDNIISISGIFSGTLGYILSELEKSEKTFSEIVKQAKELGYTEPNPMDDLNGLDVARKLIILARYAGHSVNIGDVKIEPLIDEKYGKVEGDNFFEAIIEEDNDFLRRVEDAAKDNQVLRYVGEMQYDKNSGDIELSVGVKAVPKNSSMGNLSGTSNIAVVETDILENPQPHVIISRGAGIGVTAAAVRVGIAKMLPDGLPRR